MTTWVFLAGYGLVFCGLLFGAILWRRRGRKERAPFPENTRLLRGPGETLRGKLSALDESLLFAFLLTFSAPLVVGLGLAWIATRCEGAAALLWLGCAVAGLTATLVFSIRRLASDLGRWRNVWLGYHGERIVAEALEELKSSGFRVFHDVPAGDTKDPFNIDHVLVGPTGVFAVETKTRRKGRARSGFAEHQIIFDGRVLAYPWGEDRHGLDQALRQSRWLEEQLAASLGQTIAVSPILTFPGWTIIRRGAGPVGVFAPREIPAAVATRDTRVLDERLIGLVAGRLDALCRDVEM